MRLNNESDFSVVTWLNTRMILTSNGVKSWKRGARKLFRDSIIRSNLSNTSLGSSLLCLQFGRPDGVYSFDVSFIAQHIKTLL
jgi:hypothetical protein